MLIDERDILRKAVRSFPIRKGITILVCPRCQKTHQEFPTEINALNSWAFRDGINVEMDGRGCCFPPNIKG